MPGSAKWIEGLGPQCSVEDAARRSLGPRLAAVAHLLPVAAHLAEHDVEHVHRLRVATRRATAALKLYRDCLSRKQFRWMKRQLRMIRRAAGDARDLDVLADRLMREYGEVAAPVVDLIAKDRTAVQPAIVSAADRSREDDQLVRKTAKLLHTIRCSKVEDGCKTTKFYDWAAQQLLKVANRFVAAMPNEQSSPPELHQFRIRAKALRYAIELAAPAFGRELRGEVYPMIEELQERLGRVQDHVSAIERCRNWASRTRSTALEDILRELSEAEQRGLQNSLCEFREWWTDDRAKRVRALLEADAAQDSKEVPIQEADGRKHVI